MENGYETRSGFSGGVAKTLNYTGMGLVYTYDFTAYVLKGTYKLLKKTANITELFRRSPESEHSKEYNQILDRIDQKEKRIKALYYEIGKEGARHVEDQSPLESEVVKKLLEDVKEYEKDIKRLNDRLVDISEAKSVQAQPQKEQSKSESYPAREIFDETEIIHKLTTLIDKTVKKTSFDNPSEREIFSKVCYDLLDRDIEIRALAAAELGKMANLAAVPILMAATQFDQAELTSEIINALIKLNDNQAIQTFKEEMNNTKFSVRIGCLRGIYKMADGEDILTVLTDALRDKHHEVRRTAATFLGWRDQSDAVPALVQCLKDEEERVRKAVIAALANIKDPSSVLPLMKVLGDDKLEVREKAYDAIRLITGEEVQFDVHLSGSEMSDAIDQLRTWWQELRTNKKSVELFSEDDLTIDASDSYESIDAYQKTERLTPSTEVADDSYDEPQQMDDVSKESVIEADETESDIERDDRSEDVQEPDIQDEGSYDSDETEIAEVETDNETEDDQQDIDEQDIDSDETSLDSDETETVEDYTTDEATDDDDAIDDNEVADDNEIADDDEVTDDDEVADAPTDEDTTDEANQESDDIEAKDDREETDDQNTDSDESEISNAQKDHTYY
ncbi:MAG: HEAT repeat domain-containing protein [Candidatus Magnetomorum sp.]|nr:HEAT repeat domain-containing protein [Candidatus Magnetomorum sp.]